MAVGQPQTVSCRNERRCYVRVEIGRGSGATAMPGPGGRAGAPNDRPVTVPGNIETLRFGRCSHPSALRSRREFAACLEVRLPAAVEGRARGLEGCRSVRKAA